jgi:hypothetical protein
MTLGQKLIISRLAQILQSPCQYLPNISNNWKFFRSRQYIILFFFHFKRAQKVGYSDFAQIFNRMDIRISSFPNAVRYEINYCAKICPSVMSVRALAVRSTGSCQMCFTGYRTCTELERPPERRDHQSHKVTRLTNSRPRMAQTYTNAN